jgi:hypothetical protein
LRFGAGFNEPFVPTVRTTPRKKWPDVQQMVADEILPFKFTTDDAMMWAGSGIKSMHEAGRTA